MYPAHHEEVRIKQYTFGSCDLTCMNKVLRVLLPMREFFSSRTAASLSEASGDANARLKSGISRCSPGRRNRQKIEKSIRQDVDTVKACWIWGCLSRWQRPV